MNTSIEIDFQNKILQLFQFSCWVIFLKTACLLFELDLLKVILTLKIVHLQTLHLQILHLHITCKLLHYFTFSLSNNLIPESKIYRRINIWRQIGWVVLKISKFVSININIEMAPETITSMIIFNINWNKSYFLDEWLFCKNLVIKIEILCFRYELYIKEFMLVVILLRNKRLKYQTFTILNWLFYSFFISNIFYHSSICTLM